MTKLVYLVSSTIDQLCGKRAVPGEKEPTKEEILETLNRYKCIVFSRGTGEEANLFYIEFQTRSSRIRALPYPELDDKLPPEERNRIWVRRKGLDCVVDRRLELVDNPKDPGEIFALAEANLDKLYVVNDERGRFNAAPRPEFSYLVDVEDFFRGTSDTSS